MIEQTPEAEYLALEGRLGEVFQELARLRQGGAADPRESGESRLMAEAHAKVIPRMEVLRAMHPALAARAMPQLLKTPGQLRAAMASQRVEHRLEEILATKKPVRVGLDADLQQWVVEEAAEPHLILEMFQSQEEAVLFAARNGLPLQGGGGMRA